MHYYVDTTMGNRNVIESIAKLYRRELTAMKLTCYSTGKSVLQVLAATAKHQAEVAIRAGTEEEQALRQAVKSQLGNKAVCGPVHFSVLKRT